ncbi:chromate transporter [Ancylobacter sonchi]|uniref:chromate transporter n=1 Tax=Ancylobacter sonchi TaxID=1937790 RepID=UPI001BD1FAAD|nr:chromate transporter [Ancylobacter sonchi]MBS7534335.1 chromate transporter [Ancylobacter sonchi]
MSPETAPAASEADRPAPSLRELFVGFLSVAVVAFGGVLPIARRAVVERYKWVDSDEFTELVGLAQFLPGPNIVNLSIVIGSRFRGVPGAIAAFCGLTLAPAVFVIIAGTLFARYSDEPAVADLLSGLAAGAAGLVIAMAGRMGERLWRRPSVQGLGVVAAAFIGIAVLGLPLLWVMLGLAPVSVALAWWSLR